MPAMTTEQLRRTVAELVEEEPQSIADDANLFELGLDSIALMQLVSRWRRGGFEVDFAQLAEIPTLDRWAGLLSGQKPQEGGRPGSEPTPDPGALDELFPLALLQHAYWVGRDEGQRLGGVAAHLYIEFDGQNVEPARLQAAIEKLVARHEMLRAQITDNGEQRILERSGWRGLTVHDLRSNDPGDVERRLDAIRDALSHQLLAIEEGEVFSTAVSLLPGGCTRLHLDVDMVAADAVSYRVMLADLARFYADPSATLPEIGYSYREYLRSRPETRRTAAARAAEFWRDRLLELPGTPELPLASGATGPARSTRRSFVVDPAGRAALAATAQRHAVTPAMVVMTAFAEVIGAWSTESRFLLNVPMFDRDPVHRDIDAVVGDFTSSVLLDVDLTASATFAQRVHQLQLRLHSDVAHADYSGVEVLRDLSRRSGQQVIAPVVFTSGLNLGELFDEGVRQYFGDPVWIISQGPQVLLDAQISEIDNGLLINWDIRENEIAPGVADAMFEVFERLIRALAQDGSAWESPVVDLLPAAQRQARELANQTAGPRSGRMLHEGFFAWSWRTPDAPAVLWGTEGSLSYAELADRALRVAGTLAKHGVAPGDLVGITLPQGPDQVIAVLGVLAAGATYVPVGVGQPPARVERIAMVAGYRAVIVEQAGEPPTADPVQIPIAVACAADALAETVPGDETRTAYVLFTSGSTGEPKGVEVPHRAAMNTIDDLINRFGLGTQDRTIGLSALDFDLSVFDIFAPLSVGGSVLVVDGSTRDAQRWAELILARDVTVLNCVPALLDMLLAAGLDSSAMLRLVLLGGDRVGVDLPERLSAAVSGCRFVALGGTTETAIHSTVCEVAGAEPIPGHWHSVPYGTPLRNVALRVVDHLGRDVPEWVPGELWIGGDGLAHGYRGDPERSADRFVWHEGRRWYRTGDLARYWPAGTVEFLGRRDNQVKIRGFRIELGEIEAALLADPRVHAAVAVVAGRDVPILLAGVQVHDGDDPDEIRSGLAELVPPHMVPERVFVMDRVPLSANGKVDRSAVRELAEHAPRHGNDRVAPRSALERAIALSWAVELPIDVDEVGVTDSLFALGGDSVLAIRIIAHLREDLDMPALSPRMLFADPTIAALADRMRAAEGGGDRLEQVAQSLLEVESMSDEEIDFQLRQAAP